MAEILQSNDEGAQSLATTVKQALSGYTGFNLSSVYGAAPSSGSGEHDGMSGNISQALGAWEELIDSDAKALIAAASELGGVDSSLAQKLMGVGEGS